MYYFHVADDHPLFRDALLGVIHSRLENVEVSQSATFDETIVAIQNKTDLDLLILDLNMPGSNDLYGLISIRKRFPMIPVVIVSAHENVEIISRAIGHGASGYIPKSLSVDEMSEALKTIIEGDEWIPEKFRGNLNVLQTEEKTLAEKISDLTPQQYRVLHFIREGWLNKQIAYELNVTEATIKAHVTVIFRKLGVTNRTQAVVQLNQLIVQ